MERNIHGAECSLGDITMGLNIREAKSIGRNALGTKYPWDEMPLGRNVHGAKCPRGKMFMGIIYSWGAKFMGAKCPRGEMICLCSNSKMATGLNVDGENCPHNVNRSKCH